MVSQGFAHGRGGAGVRVANLRDPAQEVRHRLEAASRRIPPKRLFIMRYSYDQLRACP